MTRLTLLATTAAILLPFAGAIAQSTDSDMTSDTVENSASPSGELSTESDVDASVSNSANEAAEEIGETAETMTVGELTGMSVIDAAGEDIGEIDMVVSDGNETSAVIGVGGFLGFGEHAVAVPMSGFRMSAEGELQLAGYTREDLGRMPEFEEDGAQVLEADASIPEMG